VRLPCTTFPGFPGFLAPGSVAPGFRFHFLPGRRTTSSASCSKLLGALARPAVSAAAREFHGSHGIGHRKPSKRSPTSLPSPRRPSSMACGFCRCGVWTLKTLWPTPWQGCAQANACRRPLCWGVFPASQHSPRPALQPIPQMGSATKSASACEAPEGVSNAVEAPSTSHRRAQKLDTGCSAGHGLGMEVCGKQHPERGDALCSNRCATKTSNRLDPSELIPFRNCDLLVLISRVFRKIKYSPVQYIKVQRPACAIAGRGVRVKTRNRLSHQNYH
jgi:hypothetical protein